MATQIRIGSLSLKLQELESSVVGAQLGSQAISTSLKAAAIGIRDRHDLHDRDVSDSGSGGSHCTGNLYRLW